MLGGTTRLIALICFFWTLQLAAARNLHALRRRDDLLAPRPSLASLAVATPTPSASDEGHEEATFSTTKAPATTTFVAASPTSLTTIYQTTIFNSTYSTVPDGELPLKPRITPGWGVAGVIMIVTGLIYTLVGIKNRLIHSFFCIAFTTALGVTVLIVYVMNIPVKDAVQGGYVVAVVLASCAFGAASVFFKELTESLACALGGFCLGMWLLCLVDGGLVTAAATKAIFLGAFSLLGFGFYFSRWTRHWAMIIFIAFAGAMVTVLGIDCFTLSGLKEFWAFIWDLNDQLFPLGANNYPVTKGIRVEAALVIIITLVGVVSQIKLWRVVREKREKRAAQLAEGQRDLDNEEATVGRNVEELNAREIAAWERTYGDRSGDEPSAASELENADGEKRGPSVACSSVQSPVKAEGDMSDVEDPRAGVDGLMSTEAELEGKLTVRVACDQFHGDDNGQVNGEKVPGDGAEGPCDSQNSPHNKKNPSQKECKKALQRQTVSPPPEIVPLPFKVPENGCDTRAPGDRSSFATFATFADDDDLDEEGLPVSRKRSSLVKRLSRNSAELFRGFSQRPGRPTTRGHLHADNSQSLEELVEGSKLSVEDDRSSLVVTVDQRSVSGNDRLSVMGADEEPRSIEITAELGASTRPTGKSGETGNGETSAKTDSAKTDAKDIEVKVETGNVEAEKPVEALKSSENAAADETAGDTQSPEAGTRTTNTENALGPSTEPKKEEGAAGAAEETNGESAMEEIESGSRKGSVGLTKDQLPKPLSKVALSFRTNEWAKHLEHADSPEPDEIMIEPAVQSPKYKKEVARSVDVEALQKTAKDNTQAAFKRSDSQEPSASSRSASRSPGPAEALAEKGGLVIDPTVKGSKEKVSGAASPTADSPVDAFERAHGPAVVSYSSRNTLLGQREQLLKDKSLSGFLSRARSPEPSQEGLGPLSDFGSLSNYPMYAAALAEADEVPLSQRKELMRQNTRSPPPVERPESARFNSHQPQRVGSLPTTAVREARLANFRSAVAQELRPRHTRYPSNPGPFVTGGLINQRETEMQRREIARKEKERHSAAVDKKMRNGELLDAHREALRRMQKAAEK